jgi:membrane-bound lytic murein transglycosylase B
MNNITSKRLLNIAVLILVSSCSSRPVVYKPLFPAPTPAPAPTTQLPPQTGSYSAATVTGPYANSVELQNFIRYMVQQYGFSPYYLNGLFSTATYLESVARLEEPPTMALMTSTASGSGSWTRYRQQFLDEAHINNGVAFWRNNAAALQKASSTYGVDPEYIVAIIGVETYFGRNVGKTRTFDALTTLAFETRRRAKFFTSELEHFLLITREEGYEPRTIVGSWAGAMGLGQFMPSSFRKLAVDFNNDGKRDLWQTEDAIGSVANYFARNGWQPQGAVAEQTQQRNAFSTVELSTYSGSELWTVYPNFKVIKKYNSSDKYAMAVHQLAQACKERYR